MRVVPCNPLETNFEASLEQQNSGLASVGMVYRRDIVGGWEVEEYQEPYRTVA